MENLDKMAQNAHFIISFPRKNNYLKKKEKVFSISYHKTNKQKKNEFRTFMTKKWLKRSRKVQIQKQP